MYHSVASLTWALSYFYECTIEVPGFFSVEAALEQLLWDTEFVLFYILQPEELLLCMLSKLYSIFALCKTSETTFSLILESKENVLNFL